LDCFWVVCGVNEACVKGECYPKACLMHPCPGWGEVCIEEDCVPSTCLGVVCPPMQHCAGGYCYPVDCETQPCLGQEEVCIEGRCEQRSCVGAICPQGQRCAQGYCYPVDCETEPCTGAFEVCFLGRCLSRSCVDVDCPKGQVCAGGFCYPVDCADPCGTYEVCRGGTCVDGRCVSIGCPEGRECAGGICYPKDCVQPCGAEKVCVEGVCQDTRCVRVQCRPVEECIDGECKRVECDVPSDCDDNNVCTTEGCNDRVCGHTNNNGAGCNDNNACTQTDTCQGGTCSGTNPVVCTALDPCHDVGTCDTGTGICSNPQKANGTGCNDSNACTQTDTCQSGVCIGSNPVVCTSLDQCHNAGTCNTATGACSNPAKSNGTLCDDSDAVCTLNDVCINGICSGTPLDVDGDGYPPKSCPGGTDCNDGDIAINPGAAEICNGADENCNDLVDDTFDCRATAVSDCTNACSVAGEGICNQDCSRPLKCLATELCGNNIDDDCDGSTDEGGCVATPDWECHNVNYTDLGITCAGSCLQNDAEFVCNTAYNSAPDGCNGTTGNCLYLRSHNGSNTGYCGYLWISKVFTIPVGSPVLHFSFKGSGASWSNVRVVAWEIVGVPGTYSEVVGCAYGAPRLTCWGTDQAGDNLSWTPHSADLGAYEGQQVRIIFYMNDYNRQACQAGDHPAQGFVKDLTFSPN
jgi:hypothetical protein